MERALTIWTYKVPVVVLVTAGFLLVLPAFWGGMSDLFFRWEDQEEYSHGFMIPLVSAYLIWQRRSLIQTLEFKPSWIPVGFAILALVIAAIGEISALYTLLHFSFVIIVLSMAWSIMGWQAFRHLLVPIGLLFFAIPLPYFLEATLTADLQLISSKLGVVLIRLFGIPVFLEGNVIDLGGYKLQVVEACSGLRYLYPLMGVGFIVAYLYHVEFWKRALVFLSTIPITILMNSFRIGVIGILVEYWGQGMADGFLHYFEGWIIFIACLGILLGEMWLLNRFSKNPVSLSQVFYVPAGNMPRHTDVVHRTREVPKPFIACALLVLAALVILRLIDTRSEVIPERQQFVSFPLYFDGWTGEQDNLRPIVYDKLRLTDYLLNNYSQANGPPVNFYVAYYESQRKGVSPHSPRVCIPGGGWSISDIDRVNLGLESDDGLVRVNRVIVQNGNAKQLVYYWFKQRGRDVASEYWMKWYLLHDSLTRSRTDGSLVRLTTPISPGETEADAEKRLNAFLVTVNPMLSEYIPG